MTSWRFTGTPDGTAEQTRELQDRIGRFARTVFATSGFMLLVSIVINVLAGLGPGQILLEQAIHLGAQLVAFTGWLVCRGKRVLSLPLLATFDALMTAALCSSWTLLGVDSPARNPVEFTVILATTYTLIPRSVMVPSTFARTLWISRLGYRPKRAWLGAIAAATTLCQPDVPCRRGRIRCATAGGRSVRAATSRPITRRPEELGSSAKDHD